METILEAPPQLQTPSSESSSLIKRAINRVKLTLEVFKIERSNTPLPPSQPWNRQDL